MGWNPFKSMKRFASAAGGEMKDLITGGAHSANKANKQMAREQMAFQERMSSTEVQRRVQDLLLAGMNPMLAMDQSASAPSGAKAEIMPEDKLKGISSALALKQQTAALDNMNEQTRLLQYNQSKTKAETNLLQNSATQTAATTQKVEAEIQKLAVEFKTAQANYDITEEQLRQARLNTRQMQRMQPLLEDYQRLLNQAEALGMTQKQVDEKFASTMGESSKFLQFLHQIFRMGK